MIRGTKAVVGLATVLGGVALSSGAAFGQSSGGAYQVWVTPSTSGNGGKVLFTGAIADYGTALSVNSSGKADESGSYEKLSLKKGTILVNSAQFNSATNNAPNLGANCTFTANGSAPITIVSGTGSYKHITGSGLLTFRFAGILPKKSNGSCNESNNASPVSQFASITGAGTVTF